MRITPKSSEVRVPRFVGLMAMDARERAEAGGVLLVAPDRPDFARTVVDYVVRQYPPPGVEVPRGAAVTVWFELGDEGGGVREPRHGGPPPGLRRALDEPGVALHVPLGGPPPTPPPTSARA
ncbi:PASTA domain-containing protein [Streptomyces sp. SP18BB07]|uniref:PASTA domain-containing protein n=1 Tax=Streptomyces sp. SP18BB07 TaxID=3002522 RepID=UPI002E79FBB7|nr:PASTA domain-containing protein [Streptomyces sp. SP18BB07]MEE1759192.1 PASTA domain-containing protein [Streptomyces sp. SP18BB07]